MEKMHNKSELPMTIPWHHPQRANKHSKIVNLTEDSAVNLLSNSSRGSGLLSSIQKFTGRKTGKFE